MQRKSPPPPPRPPHQSQAHRGRGSTINPVGRFERLDVEPDDENRDPEEEPSPPETLYLRDSSKSALASNDSPDIGFNFSLNPYRGCSMDAVIATPAPPTSTSASPPGLDFETRILVKEDAPELLRKELAKKSWEPQVVMLERRHRSATSRSSASCASPGAASRCWSRPATR